ncbi:7TM GPCR, serpentine receptor class r (Str) family-containing protein [Strongyloides ratti]|uniref:7TM GPCR, serpentine receptor class r (Str) family-containing protein n=1 Tax=Strongyloides ratti TaxID=34506 RepID=A0A090LP35_STRRB|nr:7TM GPCR, serpentine receptor class r (Str) family-containing protein [Strongyloides ratti]CEF69949.1 7TM GPCR, serpentine receptor class r (Str) family-containing protein [Strongyloides ratti]
MALISCCVFGYLRMYLFFFENYSIVILQPISHLPTSQFLYARLYNLTVFFLQFNITFPSILITARYILVCVEKNFTKFSMIKMLIFCFLLTTFSTFGISYPLNNFLPSDIMDKGIKKYNVQSLIITNTTLALGCSSADSKIIVSFIIVPLYFIINYTIIIYISIKYKLYINKYKNLISKQTQKLNKEFMIILILQAFTPIFLTGIPILGLITFMLIQKEDILSTNVNYIIHLLVFVPVINAFLFIAMSRKNRKEVHLILKKIIYIIKKNKSNTSIVIYTSQGIVKVPSKNSDNRVSPRYKEIYL